MYSVWGPKYHGESKKPVQGQGSVGRGAVLSGRGAQA